jgi:hypothetical protein
MLFTDLIWSLTCYLPSLCDRFVAHCRVPAAGLCGCCPVNFWDSHKVAEHSPPERHDKYCSNSCWEQCRYEMKSALVQRLPLRNSPLRKTSHVDKVNLRAADDKDLQIGLAASTSLLIAVLVSLAEV